MSEIEDALLFQMRALGLPVPVRNHRFMAPERQFQFDFAWLAPVLLAVEIQGGSGYKGKGEFSMGHHVRPGGYESDCIKQCEAVLRGWRVLPVTGAMVNDGRALAYIERALGRK